jgi:cytidine deaminase
MKQFEIRTTIIEYDNINELSEDDKMLIEKAKDAAKFAYAPYSKFNVGACLLLENGEFIQGNNQENAAYPSGLCAERVALFYANSKYPDVAVKKIAVSVFVNNEYMKDPIPPCGSCRQALLETEIRFKKPIQLILAGERKVQIIHGVKDLLPLSFDPKMLH